MAESIIFQCDMCGSKSEEEPSTLPRRERCRVELVFRGQRFVVAPPPAALPEASLGPLPLDWGALPMPAGGVVSWPPMWPMTAPSAAGEAPIASAPSIDEDERVSYTICDACMKRTCAFFDLKAETFEEYSGRVSHEVDLARRANSPLPGGGGTQGKMVAQYPTRERTPGHGPGPGGLVDQYPTPGASPVEEQSAAPVSVRTAAEDKKSEPDASAAEAE